MPEPGDMPAAVVTVVDAGTKAVVERVVAQRTDLALVDALARLQLAARRSGTAIHLRGASPELRALLELVGLAGALPLEAGREAELGEQLGVEEVVQPGDDAV